MFSEWLVEAYYLRTLALAAQIICTIKIRPLSELVPLSVVTADKVYDSEKNHEVVRDVLHALSVIPSKI